MPYPPVQYLSGFEVELIVRDFECLLTGCEASTITGEFAEPVSPVVDDVYGITDATSWDMSHFTGKAIQKILNEFDEKSLGFGILKAGDCIFYLSTSLDLSEGHPQTFEIIDPGGLRWVPVPREQNVYQHYLIHRIAQTQVAQVVPCRLKK